MEHSNMRQLVNPYTKIEMKKNKDIKDNIWFFVQLVVIKSNTILQNKVP